MKVGDEIECTCPRCKLILAHVILFFDADGAVGQVACRTCGLRHAYRSYKARRIRRPPPSPRTLKPLIEGGTFQERLAGLGPQRALPYRVHRVYRADDAIEHPVFGLGFVLRVREGRIEVLFREGVKVLLAASVPSP